MGRNAPPEHIVFKDFKGLRTSIGDPAPNSAIGCRNVVRSKKLGHLELGIPYEFRFPTEDANLPQSGDLEISNYLNPAIHKMTNLVFENVHNFYVPDHGGRNITVVVGTYTKTGFFPGSPTVDRSGVFVRPFWDGSAWIDAWRELTEMFIFELTSLGSTNPGVVTAAPPFLGNDATVGTVDWIPSGSPPSNPGAFTRLNDDIFIEATLNAAAQSKYANLSGGVSLTFLPVGTTIVGVTAHIIGKGSVDTCPVQLENVRLVKNGALAGTVKTDTSTWDIEKSEKTLGGAADLWGTTFLRTDTISIAVSAKNYDSVARKISLDQIYLKVHINPGGLNQINISEGADPYDFAVLDPLAGVFNGDYFKGWTIVYDRSGDNENYDLVVRCGYDGTRYFLETTHPVTDFTSRIAGTKILLYRNFLTSETPAALSSYFHNVLNEMRLTTGNLFSDLALKGGFRTKPAVIFDGSDPLPQVDELILVHSGAEDWKYAVLAAITGTSPGAQNPLSAGTYYLKYSIVYDDGSIGPLYDVITRTAGVFSASAQVIVADGEQISLTVYRSYGAFPKKGRGVNIYMSDDNVYFYRVKAFDVSAENAVSLSAVGGLPAALHHYGYLDVAVDAADWNADIPEANADIGRSPADAGIIRYTQAAVIGVHNFAVGVYANGQYQRNKVYSSAIAGSGREEYDIFPDDPIHALSVEYNDADEALSVVGLNNRIAVHKKRSIVLLRYSPNEGYIRDIVTKGWGIAAPRTLVEYDGSLYWLDYSGVMKFNENGIEIINRAWLQDLLALSDSVKEAAIATFDRNNKKYILVLGALVYHYDLLDGEWMIEDWNDLPLRFSIDNTANRVTFLAEDNSGVRNLFVLDEGIIHNGGQYDFSYETNEIDHPSPVPFDLNLMEIYLRYRSTIDFQVTAYKNDTAEVLFGPVTLSKDNYRTLIQLSDDARCSSFRIKVSGRAIDQYTSWKLKRMGMRYQPLEISGDIIVE